MCDLSDLNLLCSLQRYYEQQSFLSASKSNEGLGDAWDSDGGDGERVGWWRIKGKDSDQWQKILF